MKNINTTAKCAVSAASSWAGVGSLLIGMTMLRNFGTYPFLLWAIGNALACVVFGLIAPRFDMLRRVFRSKPVKCILGLMSIFQIWVCMNGILQAFDDLPVPSYVPMIITYIVSAGFMVYLINDGVPKGIFTDNISSVVIAGAVLALVIVGYATGGQVIEIQSGTTQLNEGFDRMILLIPGAFLYPYFYGMLDFNDQQNSKVNMRKAFVLGGIIFGAYLVFVYLLSAVAFNGSMLAIRAIVITLLATTTLASFIYGIYNVFGKKIGGAVNLVTIAGWQLVIPIGVMGVWTMMAEIRVYIVIALVSISIILHVLVIKRDNDKGEATSCVEKN